jgi:type IV pilus assembly protein PilE
VNKEKSMISARRSTRLSQVKARARGFTLIELMIAVVVVGILTAIAYPQYTEFVRRSRITEATSALDDFRTRMEQFFQDNRTYVAGGSCGIANPAVTSNSSFTVTCTGASATGYTVNAAGNASKGMGPFGYRLVVSNAGVVRSTVGVPSDWSSPSPNTCWAVRKNGQCS